MGPLCSQPPQERKVLEGALLSALATPPIYFKGTNTKEQSGPPLFIKISEVEGL